MEYLTLPTPHDVRAARVFLEWDQKKFSEKSGLNTYVISSLETGRHNPTKETLRKIAIVFFEEGIRFHKEGGFIVDKSVVTVYEGVDGPLKILEDVIRTCALDKKEFLLLGADDKRSPDKVIELYKKMYKMDIPFKVLIGIENNYILGPLEEYRKVDEELFLSKDVIVIYGDKISFCVQIKGDLKNYIITDRKHISINDKDLADTFRKFFYRLWEKGEKPKKSSTKQIFFRK